MTQKKDKSVFLITYKVVFFLKRISFLICCGLFATNIHAVDYYLVFSKSDLLMKEWEKNHEKKLKKGSFYTNMLPEKKELIYGALLHKYSV